MSLTRPKPDNYFTDWKLREALAEAMIPKIGQLYREKNVVITMYGKSLVNRSVIDIMKAHRFVRQVEQNELSEFESFPVLEALCGLDVSSAHIDLGKLTVASMSQTVENMEVFAIQELAHCLGEAMTPLSEPQDVVLYGFGRIGRLVARLLIEEAGSGQALRLRAVVVRKGKASQDLVKRASLLRRDSVHGPFNGTIRIDEENDKLVANGNEIKFIYANNPAEIDYTAYGIDSAIVVDNTGVWRDEDGLGQHLMSKGVGKVILTAPGKGAIKNIVYGINDDQIKANDRILSAASCTTNAIVPTLKVLMGRYGIRHGHVETVHSYTNDQNLIDNYHKGERRGRSAPLNMVLTETGAAKAVAKALPELNGKLTGNAIRVPTPNVSMAILNLQLEEETTREELNEFMRQISLHSSLFDQIDFTTSPEVVSTDFVGSRHACVFDAKATIVEGNSAVIYLWYDNECGYSCQVLRCLEKMAGVHYRIYPLAKA